MYFTPPVEDTATRQKARDRMFLVFQLVGWAVILLLQLLFSRVFPVFFGANAEWSIVQTIVLGFIITMLSRSLLQRWRWRDLGWRQLFPRLLLFGLMQALVWCVAVGAVDFLLMRRPWPQEGNPLVYFMFNWINFATIMIGWLFLYYFYQLFDRNNRLEIERLRAAASAKESELRALKSQINPHFLFNSLNSLRALIEEDPPRARAAVTRLSNLLRYSLRSGQLETVTLDEELAVVEDYVGLEQIRHEERLKVRFEIDPGARKVFVPPMLLQTLVENSVKYGIATRPEGGEVIVRATLSPAAVGNPPVLRLRVTNPGSITPRPGSTGLGLRNASDRLRLLFGDQAVLVLTEAPVGTVIAEASIPLTEGAAVPSGTISKPKP